MESKKESLQLFVFYTNTQKTLKYLADGADGVVIDWESKSKNLRQALFDTQINMHTVKDLKSIRSATSSTILCRVNQPADLSQLEIEDSIASNANELLLPMVKSAQEVEDVLKMIDGRCSLGILLETDEAIKNAKDFSKLPLSRIYIGLNDLAIERGYKSIFEPVFNGEIQRIRHFFSNDFGFGGLTRPSLGSPIPCRILLNEIKKHNCTYTFLRRSFFKDSERIESSVIIDEIRKEANEPIFTYESGFDYKSFFT